MQLSRTPAPTLSAAPPPQPDPWWRRPWPPGALGGGAALGALPEGWRRPPGSAATSPRLSATRTGVFSPAGAPLAPLGQAPAGAPPAPPAPPALARPSAPLRSWAREGAQLTPRAGAGARAGCVTSGGVAPPAAESAALRGFLGLASKLSAPLAPLALVSPRAPSFSPVPRLFFPG